MDYVFSTTQRLLGYIPESEIWDMTPKHWTNLIKGARHQLIDLQEVQITGAVAMARMNNGQNIRALTRHLNERRELIDKNEDQYEYEKKLRKSRRKYVHNVQKDDMKNWWKDVQQSYK